MPILHIKYEAGTTGTLTFQCLETLYDTDGNIITPPFEEVATLSGGSPSVANPVLRSGLDPDVSPQRWSYRVVERITGHTERILFLTMPMTDADAVDVIVVDQPAAPELFVLKSVFDAHVDSQTGGGLTQADADLLYDPIGAADDEETRATAAELALSDDLAQEIIDRTADVDAEETRATAAEVALGDDITAEVARATGAEGTLTTNLATEVTNRTAADVTEVTNRNAAIAVETAARIADVDAEETRALGVEATLAPLASPVFTGNPQAPSPTAGDSDTSIATTQFVTNAITTAISALIAGAPGALDTLKELADAINDDASFAATITAALALKINAAVLTTDGDLLTRIAGVPARLTRAGLAGDTAFSSVYETIANVALKAPLASPTFTGDPKAPTPTAGDSDTSIATTAFVTTADGLLIPKSLMTTDGDLISRAAGVPVRITRASLAADTAFSSVYATLASPTLTGNPLAPTPSVDDNDTSIATTGFVQANSSKLWSSTSTSAPSDSVGQDGDYYIIQDSAGDKNRVMYGPKASGTWTGVAKQLFLPETHGTLEFLRSNNSGDQSLVWQALTTGDMPPIVVCTVSDSAVNVPDTTTTIIGLTATESLDTDAYHSNVTNPSRIVVPTNYGGWHMASARASWASNATGYRRLNILVSGVTRYTLYVVPAASGSAMNFAFTLMVNLSAGDFVQVEAQQTSGGNLACTLSEFTVMRLPQP